MNEQIDWNNPNLDLDKITWIPDIDSQEWFITEYKKNIDNITNFDVNYLKEKLKLKIDINIKEKKVTIYDKSWYEIWRIEPWTYKMHNWETSEHLYKKVDESLRWKWYWTILMNLYKNNFELPLSESSYKISAIRFLKNFWYRLEYKIINWEKILLSKEEIYELLYWDYINDELNSTYILVLDEYNFD